MNNKPLDKGRVVFGAEKYPDGQGGTKTRYATVGRATLWPNEKGGQSPSVSIDLDSVPVSTQGPIKLMVFWDSDSNDNQQQRQQPQQQQGGYNQQGQQQGGFNQQQGNH